MLRNRWFGFNSRPRKTTTAVNSLGPGAVLLLSLYSERLLEHRVRFGVAAFQSLATRVYFQHFVQITINMKTPGSAMLTLCEGDPPETVGLPQQMVNNAESISIR